VVATRSALALGDVVVTEAGFGSDLGAEKFFDIKCRAGGLSPEAAVLVATVRSLKMQGGMPKTDLAREDLAALERGLAHLGRHVANVRQFGVPLVVAVNRFTHDTEAELARVEGYAASLGVPAARCDVWARGGEGGEELGRLVLELLDRGGADFRPLYDADRPVRETIDTIVQRVYGGEGADYTPHAARALDHLAAIGLDRVPVCMAKTQYSFTDDPSRLGTPTGFRVTIEDVTASAGAGFVVARAGDIMTMPGLPPTPAATRMARRPDGTIVGLF
jgi:formate--tetrahydrofolate ligase